MSLIHKLRDRLFAPFIKGSEVDYPLLILFVLINGLVLLNAFLHDPKIGYDADRYLKYIEVLSTFRLPTPQDTLEFFSAPLPFFLPALLLRYSRIDLIGAAKFAQFLNVLLSLGTTFFLVKIASYLDDQKTLRFGALLFLGLLTVYYKTFAFVRGEPYVVFFSTIIFYFMILLLDREEISLKSGAVLGILLGLNALSRQWGIPIVIPVSIIFLRSWFKYPQSRPKTIKAFGICITLFVLIGGWFYATLHTRYGSVTAFNREPADQFALSNQPEEFYIGISSQDLFTNPIRPNFPNQLIPILYSETWGDYWAFFKVFGMDTRTQEYKDGLFLYRSLLKGDFPEWLDTNYGTIGKYLGRVNLLAVFPTGLAVSSLFFVVLGLFSGKIFIPPREHNQWAYGLLGFTMILILGVYAWFLILYPNLGKGDTIKATYIIHLFLIVALFVGTFLDYVNDKSPKLYRLILIVLGMVFIHNLPAMITNYVMFP